MKIESKFELGQTVYWIHGNQLASGEVVGLEGEQNFQTGMRRMSVLVTFGEQDYPMDYRVGEDQLFASKEDLISTLNSAPIFGAKKA